MATHVDDPTKKTKILQALEDQNTSITFTDPLENDLVLNMGPQHPATHGVLRLLLRLDGERVIGCIPEIGYLHRGYEKLAESCTFHEFIPQTGWTTFRRFPTIRPMLWQWRSCSASRPPSGHSTSV